MATHRRTRFHLTGRVCVEGRRIADQSALLGRQGRLALVRLVGDHHRQVPTDELAALLWGDRLPRSAEASLRALVSKLRTVLHELDPTLGIASDAGCYRAVIGDAWVDIEAAANAVDRGEGALRRADLASAWSEATVGAGIARRPLLPGEDHPWVAGLRGRLRALHVRSLHVLAEVYLAADDHPLAITTARELTDLEPFREAGYRQLMRAHLAAGDRGEAVRVHGRLRHLLADELGVDPAPETQALLRVVLGADLA